MSKSSASLRLSKLWRRRAGAATPSEPADLGTAFGLELSMLPDDETPAEARQPTPRPWWQRLTQRPAN